MFGAVRAVIELVFLYGKKLMKRSGVCERKLAVLVFSVVFSQTAQHYPILWSNSRNGDSGGGRIDRSKQPFK